jgi:cystathionine beta-lyase family protein involved in aluminum resistance
MKFQINKIIKAALGKALNKLRQNKKITNLIEKSEQKIMSKFQNPPRKIGKNEEKFLEAFEKFLNKNK